jgi:hypothetical protein
MHKNMTLASEEEAVILRREDRLKLLHLAIQGNAKFSDLL